MEEFPQELGTRFKGFSNSSVFLFLICFINSRGENQSSGVLWYHLVLRIYHEKRLIRNSIRSIRTVLGSALRKGVSNTSSYWPSATIEQDSERNDISSPLEIL